MLRLRGRPFVRDLSADTTARCDNAINLHEPGKQKHRHKNDYPLHTLPPYLIFLFFFRPRLMAGPLSFIETN
jgi:hypothetical protein